MHRIPVGRDAWAKTIGQRSGYRPNGAQWTCCPVLTIRRDSSAGFCREGPRLSENFRRVWEGGRVENGAWPPYGHRHRTRGTRACAHSARTPAGNDHDGAAKAGEYPTFRERSQPDQLGLLQQLQQRFRQQLAGIGGLCHGVALRAHLHQQVAGAKILVVSAGDGG